MKRIQYSALTFICSGFMLLASCGHNIEEEKQKQYVADTVLKTTPVSTDSGVTLTAEEFAGMKLFMRNCNKCHPGGEQGKGPSLNDKSLPNFLIHMQVRTGRGDMPRFTEEQISKDQLKQITAFVKLMQHLTKE